MTDHHIHARLVQCIDGRLRCTEFGPEADLIAAMEVRGFTFTGLNNNPHQRAELQGAPRFAQLCGPMWDGNAIRYEDRDANDVLSA
jgi:hypothetical protein